MKSRWVRAVLAAGVAMGVFAGVAPAATPRSTVQRTEDRAMLFGAREAILSPALSPDGTRIVYLSADAQAGVAVMVAAVDGSGTPISVLSTGGAAARITGCDWADNSRLVCTTYSIANADGRTLTYARLLAVDADGKRLQTLSQTTSAPWATLRRSQYDGRVLDWLQGDTGKLLVMRDHVPESDLGTRLAKTANGYGVDLVDTHSLSANRVEGADPSAIAYLADGKGVVRMKATQYISNGGYIRGGSNWYYRTPGDRQWRSFSTVDGDDNGMRPISIDAATDSVFCLDRLDGRDALYRVSLDGRMTRTLVHADPAVDVDDVVRLGRQARLIGASMASDTRNIVYFEPTFAALARSLSKALPGLPIVDFVGASADESKLLVFAGGDTDPGRYYMLDRKTNRLAEIALARPQLEHVALATMTAVRYPATDGTMVPAYLTMPPWGPKQDIPAIVMPHGGPASRDEWGFDWLVQFYATQGYAVLQPQFRGSTGYGEGWMLNNGFRSWRTAIGDVVDAGRWLVAKRIADPARLAIVGWSYGGYAALQSQVVAPDLFKAVVAIAPVTDFDMLRQEHAGFTNANLAAGQIGSGPEAQAGSPLRHVTAFKAPVLMFHGTLDQNVGVQETSAMSAALRGAGKTASAVIYDGLDHSLPSSEIRADMLRRSDAFLRASMKMPPAPTVAAAETKTGA